jgi:hypothetical protein
MSSESTVHNFRSHTQQLELDLLQLPMLHFRLKYDPVRKTAKYRLAGEGVWALAIRM